MSRSIQIALAAAAGAAAVLLVSGTAHADLPAALPGIGSTPNPVAPEGELVISGRECVGTGGTPGVVHLALQNPDGSTLSTTVTDLAADGSWAAEYTAPSAAGSYLITATCDLYGSTLPYPATTVTVAAGGAAAPATGPVPAEATQDDTGPATEQVAGELSAPAGAVPAAGGAPGETSTPELATDDLAVTGSPVDSLGGLAAALVLSGLAATLGGRRRRA